MNSGRNRSSTSPTFEPLESRQLLASTISGIVFTDANANGRRDVGETGIANQRVFLDTDFDGKLGLNDPSTLTNSKGEYTFSNLTAGVWRVRLVVPSGVRQTSPGTLFYDISATGIGNDLHVANDFGLNGKFDKGTEKSRLTDDKGAWRFAGLKAGTYVIRVKVPTPIEVTTPSKGFLSITVRKGQSISNRLFGIH
jgi:hypothetical protein